MGSPDWARFKEFQEENTVAMFAFSVQLQHLFLNCFVIEISGSRFGKK